MIRITVQFIEPRFSFLGDISPFHVTINDSKNWIGFLSTDLDSTKLKLEF